MEVLMLRKCTDEECEKEFLKICKKKSRTGIQDPSEIPFCSSLRNFKNLFTPIYKHVR